MLANAAIGRAWIAASVPPASTMSARPSRIWSRASEIDSVPEAHAAHAVVTAARAPPHEARADTGVSTAARAPTYRLIGAAGAFGISIGTASGDTRRGPFSSSA